MTNSIPSLPTYVIDAIAMGYTFECPCGELLRTIAAARTCRKCRSYSHFGGRYVTNVATGELVYGTLPSEQEVAEAAARAEAREAADAAYYAEMEALRASEEAMILAERQEEAYWAKFFKWDTEAESLGF